MLTLKTTQSGGKDHPLSEMSADNDINNLKAAKKEEVVAAGKSRRAT